MKYFFEYIVSDGSEAAADTYFSSFITADIVPIVFMLIFLMLTAWIVFRGVEKGIEKGIEKGVQQGLGRANALNVKLADAGRADDIIRAASDRTYQEQLFKEFGI